MNRFQNINIKDFDYNLSDDKIAKYPLQQRDASKLLVFNNSKISTDRFYNISEYIPNDSLILFNNTKVINARLNFKKETGSKIEIFCLEPIKPSDYYLSFNSVENCTWKCLIGNNKKWKEGKLKSKLVIKNYEFTISVSKINNLGDSFEILFEWDNDKICFSDILEAMGNIPIPPYLNRNSEEIDKSRYQTIYSKFEGSVAAPTAGLHFTESLLDKLKANNIIIEDITLHVGAGTFHPVKTDEVYKHEMHTEYFKINKSCIENIIKKYGNITVVGTTTVRTIESTFQVALQVFNNPNISSNDFVVSQFEAYEYDIKSINILAILENLVNWMKKNNYDYLNCATQIMILPGYSFKIVNRLITNFHQPKSTLLLLLAAFIGNEWKKVYSYALDNDFRFLSYGDSSIFIKS